jgi:hypothetical protein
MESFNLMPVMVTANVNIKKYSSSLFTFKMPFRANSDGRSSKAYVCGHLIAGIAGSNATEGVDIHPLFLLCVV